MLVVHRKDGRLDDRQFRDLSDYLGPGDCLVFNDSRVIPARLFGHRAGHTGHVEVLLVRHETDPLVWTALVRPGRKLPVGERIEFAPGFSAEIIGRAAHGERTLRFKAGDPEAPAAVTALGFPACGVFVIAGSDPSRPVKGLTRLDEVVSAIDREANRSDDGLAIVIADMRAHRNPMRMKVLRALSWRLAKRLHCLCPACGAPGFGHIDSRRGLPCEACSEPTHWIDFEIDGCSACKPRSTSPVNVQE